MIDIKFCKNILKLCSKSNEKLFVEIFIDSKQVYTFELYPGVMLLNFNKIYSIKHIISVTVKKLEPINKRFYFTNDLSEKYKQPIMQPTDILKQVEFKING